MMNSMRRMAGGFVAKILIGLLALTFAIWGVHDVFRGWGGNTLVTVGNQKVSVPEFQRAFEQQLRRFSQQIGQTISPELARQFGIDRQVLIQLSRDATLSAQADAMGLAVPDDVIVADVAAMPDFKDVNGNFNVALFRQVLARNGATEQDYLRSERTGRQRQLLASAVSGGIKVPDILVSAIYQQMNETRDARYFILKADEAKITAPTDEVLQKFHADNSTLFTAPAYRSIAVISAEPEALAASMTVTNQEVTEAYEKRKEEYGTPELRDVQQLIFPTQEEADKAAARLAQGEDILAIAKERGLAEKDVNLGEVSRSQIADPALAEAAFGLEAGKVSAVIKTRLAFGLIRVNKVTPGVQKPLSEVRADVEQKLKLDKAKDEVLAIHDKVEDARGGGATFEEIARDLKLPINVIAAVDANGKDKAGSQVAGVTAPVLQAAFESDVGVENDAVPTPTDGFAWFDVREVMPSAVQAFDQVKDKVLAAWKKQELAKQAMDAGKALAERAAKGEALDALAAGAKIETAAALKRMSEATPFGERGLAALFATQDKAIGYAPLEDGTSVIVFEAGTITVPAFDGTSKDAEAIRESVRRGQASDMYEIYIAELQKRLSVDVNSALWQQLSGTGTGG